MSTEWIKPGADIAVYVRGNDGDRRLRRLKVARVATKSFTVTGVDERFNLETMATKTIGGSWSGWQYRATRPDSEQAAAVATRDERDRLRGAAYFYLSGSVDDLTRVDAAIKELREWRAVLVKDGGVS
ncbi:hypothetical protein ACIBCH_09720 [Amycolatopsis thailandensis]|uniref:beta barrel domain-containing protein n=1 Tax=Amycolatopsis thailandensis TaxID=589330 RepID=UPI0037A4B27F